MKTLSFIVEIPRRKRRASELYDRDSPFKPKRERNRVLYNRKLKHRNRDEQD